MKDLKFNFDLKLFDETIRNWYDMLIALNETHLPLRNIKQ